MRRYQYWFAVILFIVFIPPVKGQEFIKNSSITGVCYAGNKVTRIYIPPPDSFFKKSGSKGGGSITFYYTGFTTQAKAAMEYARLILQSMLPADTKLTIVASWEPISTSGVLANTSITGYAAGWGIDALNPLAYYPVALAEKIAGESLNPDLQGDMELRVNSSSSVSWYLGIDGKTPATQYDLVTVVIHEICHGLGFFDSMGTDDKVGYYGSGSLQIPMIYDTFIEALSGNKLTDTLKFLNPSTALRTELTGGQLWFNGPLLRKYTSGTRVKLHAPSTFDPGSSISHLDESATLKINSLMTPFIDRGEAIHDPGKLTFSILGDLGWINTRIEHTPSEDTEQQISSLPLSINVVSDTLYNRNNVGVVYSFDGFKTIDTVYMASPGSNNTFSTGLNITSYNTDLQYYFFVEDYFHRIYRSPSLFEMFRYHVYIGSDTVKPVISHNQAEYYLETVDAINIKAIASDNIGIDTVYIEYKMNNGTLKYAGFKQNADTFSLSLNTNLLNLNGGDTLKYRIYARDAAASPNTAVLPENGYFKIGIEDISDVVDSYSTDFSNAYSDFLNKGFEIRKPVNFTRNGLHTKHPYLSPESNDASIEYFALLRHPLKFRESGLLIRFSEVVLVEPGETGSVFGSEDFYDYVIIDGSKDFGRTWFAMIDGYDSRYSSSWLTTYNNSIVGQNSTAAGTESMLQKRTIYYKPSDNISAGDTLLLRFRLFSDPFANGWGWGIEDLKINSLIDNIESTYTDQLAVYPNPGNGIINLIDYKSGGIIGRTKKVSVFNSAGICIINSQIADGTGPLVNISAYPAGIYIIVLYRDDGIKTFKYSLLK
jgi:hypothetical protein